MPKVKNPIELEFGAKTAAALGRHSIRLRKALDALQSFDRDVAAGKIKGVGASVRTRLVEESAEAFWNYVVQRELLGLQDAKDIAKEYGVPLDVWAAIGPKRSR
jgi:hypothetical protein